MAKRKKTATLEPTTEDRVREIAQWHLHIPDDMPIDMEADVMAELGADSLDVVEVVMDVEEAFGVKIPVHEMDKMRNLAQLARYVRNGAE